MTQEKMNPMKIINQKKIVRFVRAVEEKKRFKRDPNLVFRHLISEMGELDKAMWGVEKTTVNLAKSVLRVGIAEELLDIIFLTCYMADLYEVNLNAHASYRMRKISDLYGVGYFKK